MATQAFSGGITIKRGDGADPEVFTLVPECIVAPTLGASKGEIDVSSCDSVNNKDYIAEYLGTGENVSMEFNYIIGDAQQAGLISDYKGSVNRNYEISLDDGTKTLTNIVTLTPLGWGRPPSFVAQHKQIMNYKITGDFDDAVTTNA